MYSKANSKRLCCQDNQHQATFCQRYLYFLSCLLYWWDWPPYKMIMLSGWENTIIFIQYTTILKIIMVFILSTDGRHPYGISSVDKIGRMIIQKIHVKTLKHPSVRCTRNNNNFNRPPRLTWCHFHPKMVQEPFAL